MLGGMVDKCSRFRGTLLICLTCMVATFLLYVWMLPKAGNYSPYGTKVPLVLTEEEAHSHGLYKSSLFVDELNKSTYEVVMRGKTPTVILYYASWCGHCRHFVKPYTAIAEKSLKRILTINSDSTKNKKNLRENKSGKQSLHFTAVDCAEYSSICTKADVRSYPTLVAYRNGASQGKVVGATEKEANTLINNVYFQSMEDSAVAGNSTETTRPEDASALGAVNSAMLLSHRASPQQRFSDALVSLDYLLVHELGASWTEEHRSTLLQFISTLLALFPKDTTGSSSFSSELTQKRSLYEEVLEIIRRDDSGQHKFLSDKIKSKVHEHEAYRTQWQVCGVVALENNTTDNSGSANSGTSSVATGTGTETGTGKPRNRRVFAPHHPRDHSPRTPALGGATATAGRGKLRVAAEARRETTEAEVKAEEKAEAATELSNRKLTATTARESASGSGYTCGLWFLFHYLTVAAGEPHYVGRVTATQLMASIHDLVRDFFSCHMCREHFLKAYDDCVLGRCNITATDYPQLQLWFFHQHNTVTYWRFHKPVDALAGDAGAAMLWPAPSQCIACLTPVAKAAGDNQGEFSNKQGYDPSIYDASAVLTYLKSAYLL